MVSDLCCLSRVVSSDDSCLVRVVQEKYPLADVTSGGFFFGGTTQAISGSYGRFNRKAFTLRSLP